MSENHEGFEAIYIRECLYSLLADIAKGQGRRPDDIVNDLIYESINELFYEDEED